MQRGVVAGLSWEEVLGLGLMAGIGEPSLHRNPQNSCMSWHRARVSLRIAFEAPAFLAARPAEHSGDVFVLPS